MSPAALLDVSSTPGWWADLPGHFSGGVSSSLFLAGRASVSAGVSFAPVPYTFVRAGLYQDYASAVDGACSLNGPALSWGIGYDDWHPGTFSVQVNNWGPVRPKDGWSILTGAELDVAYKVPLPAQVAKHLGTTLRINMPVSRSPGAAASVRVVPFGFLFFQVGVRYTPFIDGWIDPVGEWTWTYGLGWDDWRPLSLSVGYYNWGPNTIPDTNFEPNGLISLTWKWQGPQRGERAVQPDSGERHTAW